MKKPVYPCKFGVYLETNFSEYEHFVGYLLDTEVPEEGEQADDEW